MVDVKVSVDQPIAHAGDLDRRHGRGSGAGLRGQPGCSLADNFDGTDLGEQQHPVGIQVATVARRDKAADRLRGLDHVQHTDPIVRPHTGFRRY